MARSRRGFGRLLSSPTVVSVIRLSGVIGGGGRFSRGLEDAALAPIIDRAFKPKKLAAVALAVNSPGGSPAQSALIASRIRDAAQERSVPVLAFCEDVAASGGYMLACAADEIYADASSIIGSIGVVSSSFGLHGAIEKLGVERRLQTAGDNKARLDPFQPLDPADVAWLGDLQRKLHENFIRIVLAARGDRLGENPDPEVFSGEVYLAEDAIRLGLIDGVGRLEPVIRSRFGERVEIHPIERPRGLLSRLSGRGGAAHEAAALADGVDSLAGAFSAERLAAAAIDEVERRALWARYGL